MDRATLAERIARAREDAGMTQDGLGRAARLDEGAVSELENGERVVDTREIAALAEALGRPLSVLVAPPVPAAVSRRQDLAVVHETTLGLDIELEAFAADVRTMSEMALLESVERPSGARLPNNHEDAERMALEVRRRLGLNTGSVPDLADACQRLGLHVFSVSLGQGGPDGACVEVHDGPLVLGACVVNGDAPPGRRRMTLAHELGHWLSGDAYDAAPPDSEQMINSFAIQFLAPRAGVQAVWDEYMGRPVRDRALAIAAVFRVSWSAALGHLRTFDLIDAFEHQRLRAEDPRRGDYLRLGLSFPIELAPPALSTDFAAAVVNAYVARRLTADRAVELLRGTLERASFPEQAVPMLDDLRRSFAEHDG